MAPRRISGGATFVAMMQAADFGNGNDSADFRPLDRPRIGSVLSQPQMRAAAMGIPKERMQVARQAARIEHDNMIQALAADGTDHAFHVGALPGRSRRR